ncbi:MAG: phage holin family protein [Oscillospiraceae bacterium]|jgi:toxin secretion/phage lysis holin|nr:phage holin family protein [Oscillospiraceae bacterium]
MKKIILEGLIAAPFAGFLAYFGQMELPVVILALAMLADLGTGLSKAWVNHDLNSQKAFTGALKKVASVVAVAIGVGVDLLLPTALVSIGVNYNARVMFGLLVVLWLCVNEFVSVLENLYALGVPFPAFLETLVNALKARVESSAGAAVGGIENEKDSEEDGGGNA